MKLLVQASFLALHPTVDSPEVTHWLGIHSEVEVLEVEGTHALVRLEGHPAEHPVEGWVAKVYLGEEKLTPEQTMARANDLRFAEDRVTWLERAFALDPRNPIVWRQLMAARHPGQSHDPSDEAVEVAVCAEGRVTYLGALNGTGFTPDPYWDGTREQLRDLGGRHWMRVTEGRLEVVRGSPFAAAFPTETWNESEESAFVPGHCDTICEDQKKKILGPCAVDGDLYVSRRVEPLQVTPSDAPTGFSGWHTDPAGQRVRAVGTTVEAWTWDDVRATWGVVGSPSFSFDAGVTKMDDPAGEPSLEATWFKPDASVRRVAVVPTFRGGRHTGWTVVVLDADSTSWSAIELSGWGC